MFWVGACSFRGLINFMGFASRKNMCVCGLVWVGGCVGVLAWASHVRKGFSNILCLLLSYLKIVKILARNLVRISSNLKYNSELI